MQSEQSLVNLYIVLDAARISGALDDAQRLQEKFLCLYKGASEESLSAVAPYLFSCSPDSELMIWFMEKGWGNSWGIKASGRFGMEDFQSHLRRFLMVKTEDGRELYFRFYDPRVLRIFLPTCDKQQLKEFFGPVEKFIAEDEDPGFALVYSLNTDGTLRTDRMPSDEYLGSLTFVHTEAVSPSPPLPVESPDPEVKPEPPASEPGKRKWFFLDE
jgi:hypothetical protein